MRFHDAPFTIAGAIVKVNAGKFWSTVRLSKPCWEWKGDYSIHGYGLFHGAGHQTHAHRVAWYLTYGQIPRDLLVLHHCDNRACVTPWHLFLGTHQDNSLDMHAKGRWKRYAPHDQDGSKNKMARHTEREISRMLALYKAGLSQVRISKLCRISRPQLCMIVNNKAWRHVERAL